MTSYYITLLHTELLAPTVRGKLSPSQRTYKLWAGMCVMIYNILLIYKLIERSSQTVDINIIIYTTQRLNDILIHHTM